MYDRNNLVLSVWSRGKEVPFSGCTCLTAFFSNKPKPLSKVFVVTVTQSTQGTWDLTEMFVMACLEDVQEYVRERFQEFVEHRCYLCGGDRDTKAEFEIVLGKLTKNHATAFGECSRDYEISYSSVDVM
jgi:hypothetical protein